MISHTQAERIAAAIADLRPDWLASSITKLILDHLQSWSLLDVTVGLAYIAVDRKGDGSWASRTPGRVREHGPWRTVGVTDPDAQARSEQAAAARTEQHADSAVKAQAIAACQWCDGRGRLANDHLCTHVDPEVLAERAATRSAAARAAIRPLVAYARDFRKEPSAQ